MRNIILQHWTGELDELCHKSSSNIQRYANKVDAEYRLLRGNIFHPDFTPPCQKLYMLNEEFDQYDYVVMLDMDMFTRRGAEDNIFDENITGIGMHTHYQSKIYHGLHTLFPNLTDPTYPYWGGAIYKLNKQTRQQLRQHIKFDIIKFFSGAGRYEDEGIMHYLACQQKLNKCKLPDNNKWCCGNFEREIQQAALIHIRHKIIDANNITIPTPKIKVYKDLVNKGLIEP